VIEQFRTALLHGIQGDPFRAYALASGFSMATLNGGAVLALVHVFNGDDFGRHFKRAPAKETVSLQMWHRYAEETMVEGLKKNGQLAPLQEDLRLFWKAHKDNVASALFATYPQAQQIDIDASTDMPEQVLYRRG